MPGRREYKRLDLTTIFEPEDISSSVRYQTGDPIRVPRSGGGASLGVVVGDLEDDALLVEVTLPDGRAGRKEMSASQVAQMNPLKLGEMLELHGRPYWISDVDEAGDIIVLDEAGQRVEAYALREELDRVLAGREQTLPLHMDKTMPMSADDVRRMTRPPERAGTGPLPMARPLDSAKYVPIESMDADRTLHGLIAGNKETDTVYGLRSVVAGAALHTDRGENYKDWNEDGGCLFADRRGRLYVGVFDQAGGEGRDENSRGAASAIAAQALFDRMRVVADKGGSLDDAEKALVDAAFHAHDAIMARGLHEVTTYVGAMIDTNEAVIVNVGDSGAMHYSAGGEHLQSTEAQGVGRFLFEGLGKRYKEGKGPTHQTYRWKVAPGQYLVLGSDGLFDAKLTEAEIGKIISKAGTAANATRALRDIITDRMKVKSGKPDNLTILVARVGDS